MNTFPPGQPVFPHAQILTSVTANHLRHHSGLTGISKVLALNPLQLLLGTFGYLADGGTLWITDAGLDFAPHGVNLSTQRVGIRRDEIARIRRRRVLTRVGFDVEMRDRTVVPFVCWKNDEAFGAFAQLGIATA